ncbi:hypothetical protein [Nonomuraea jiangxiensis]|uniref:Uncharacterized protein n=1 Tax=Nonomuraea jiangxiensis TaxID=633440 RepID=A0A1G9R058_9ACTN|nr:hypothetical protein [Nonomuraea jiangxiensis]SDM16656.1 hypothetical protein SAMN05421869_13775 [Nonomuraea jiangxiensis]
MTRQGDGDQDVFHPERDEVAHYYRFGATGVRSDVMGRRLPLSS